MICEICGKEFELLNRFQNSRKYCFDCVPSESQGVSHKEVQAARRRAIKSMLVERAGGKCQMCGYSKCLQVLEFHHIDPSQKDFEVSSAKDIATLKREADKCVLLCSNCHAELHQKLSSNAKTSASALVYSIWLKNQTSVKKTG